MPVALFSDRAYGAVYVFHEGGRFGCTCNVCNYSLTASCKHVRLVLRARAENSDNIVKTRMRPGTSVESAPTHDSEQLRLWLLTNLVMLRA